jgi:carotenoid cleavage dioxygenase
VVQVGCRYMPVLDANGAIDAMRTAKDVAELVMHARLWVWRMNMKTGETEEHVLDPDRNVEFPTYNSALTGRRTRYGYLVDHSEKKTLQWYGIRKYDLDTGQCLGNWSDDPENSWYSEPWFAAADNPESEDHGYIISFQWNEKLARETLDIFDARDVSAGPVAQVLIPHRIPIGFHACWMASSRLKQHA